LYNGTTLLFRQFCGASYLIAVLLIKSVRIGTDAVPNHFKHYNGSKLRPVLLFALKCFESTCCTSDTCNLAVATSVNGTNVSSCTYFLQNKFWLKVANFSADKQFSAVILLLNMPQKRVG
jgi:hypothetical protein